MNEIQNVEESLVIRTDFSNDQGWERVRNAVLKPVGDFRAYVEFLDDRAYDGLRVETLLELIPADTSHAFVFLVDSAALSDPDNPILVVDLFGEPGRTFRVVPSAMWAVENNLSLANMDWEDFSENVDEHGVFRGFENS